MNPDSENAAQTPEFQAEAAEKGPDTPETMGGLIGLAGRMKEGFNSQLEAVKARTAKQAEFLANYATGTNNLEQLAQQHETLNANALEAAGEITKADAAALRMLVPDSEGNVQSYKIGGPEKATSVEYLKAHPGVEVIADEISAPEKGDADYGKRNIVERALFGRERVANHYSAEDALEASAEDVREADPEAGTPDLNSAGASTGDIEPPEITPAEDEGSGQK
jgi:hypothetical protein